MGDYIHVWNDGKALTHSHLSPVRSSRLGSGPHSSDGISLLLLGQKIQRHLQADGLHVILAERWRHVHVHLQEATWQAMVGCKRGSTPAQTMSPSPHLLVPHLPDPSPVWSVNWRTIRMTSGLCWSRWSRPAGSKPLMSTSLTLLHDECWRLTLRNFMSLSLRFSHQE